MALPQKFQAWLYAFRLRTLPLAFSSILTGSFIFFQRQFSWWLLGLTLLTTLLLQILSNLSNDFGDSEKGTDNENRIGPKRAVQAGLLSVSEIKMGIAVCVALCILSGGTLLALSIPNKQALVVFLILAVASIVAAITYTVGKRAYGYSGFGDLAVLFFFGFVGVGGSFFLQQKIWEWSVLLPGATIGLFATGVLNLNNMRDRAGDQLAGKHTLVVKMGASAARKYHLLLVLGGWATALIFTVITFGSSLHFLYILTAPLFWRHLLAVKGVKEDRDYDPLLKQLAISTFFFSILFAAGQCCSA
ncbi:MAG: 1,4-dihydroxy-2-naphthoate octaprenyltransferase [Chitinophagales bacterium]